MIPPLEQGLGHGDGRSNLLKSGWGGWEVGAGMSLLRDMMSRGWDEIGLFKIKTSENTDLTFAKFFLRRVC